MADPEHLRILKQGVKAFNEWRDENPDIELDLIKADLSEADLKEADLEDADLSQADLSRANLRGANLINAALYEANLRRAVLAEAVLVGASLFQADLRKADLKDVDLSRTDLGADLNTGQPHRVDISGADDFRANLSGANLNRANLSGHDLSEMNLIEMNLRGANLRWTNLSYANLSRSDISGANITGANLHEWKIEGIKCNHIIWKNNRIEYENPHDFEKVFTEIENVVEILLDLPFSELSYLTFRIIEQAINQKYGEGSVIFTGLNAIANTESRAKFLGFSTPNELTEIKHDISGMRKELKQVFEDANSKNNLLNAIGWKSEIDIPFTGGALVVRPKEIESVLNERYVQMKPLLQQIIQTIFLHIR